MIKGSQQYIKYNLQILKGPSISLVYEKIWFEWSLKEARLKSVQLCFELFSYFVQLLTSFWLFRGPVTSRPGKLVAEALAALSADGLAHLFHLRNFYTLIDKPIFQPNVVVWVHYLVT